MQDMNELRRMGMISDDYLADLERSMVNDQSIHQFKSHLDKVASRPTQEHFIKSRRKASSPTAKKRKQKRKAQRKARRATA